MQNPFLHHPNQNHKYICHLTGDIHLIYGMKTCHMYAFVCLQTSVGKLEDLLEIHTSSRQIHKVAILSKTNPVPNDQHGNQRFCLTDSTEVIKTQEIVHLLHVLHDCHSGECRVVEKDSHRRMEQETVSSVQRFLKHNNSCSIYLVNKFRLGKVSDKVHFQWFFSYLSIFSTEFDFKNL